MINKLTYFLHQHTQKNDEENISIYSIVNTVHTTYTHELQLWKKEKRGRTILK